MAHQILSIANINALFNLENNTIWDSKHGPNVFNLKNKIKIPVPSIETQEKLIEIFEEKEKYMENIDNKIESEKKYIDDLKQLSKDIISSYC